MKKLLCLLCVLLLTLAIVFAACNKTTPTELVTRWENDEEYLFNVTLADFSKENMYSFNTYPHGDGMYSKDFRIQTNSVLETAVTDEMRPEEVIGTYHVKIHSENGFTELTTKQVLYSQYNRSNLEKLDKWNDLQKFVSDEEQGFVKTDNVVVLKSVTETYVKFATGTAQKPVQSETSVNGYYIGEHSQTVSQYVVTANYDFDAKTVTLNKKLNGSDQGEESTNALTISANVNLIDSNQLFLYARSLDKSAAFQDAPSATVYNAYENKHYTASFALTLEQNAILTQNGENKFVKLNATAISIGATGISTTGFMMQENLPNLVEKDIDTTTNPGDASARLAKHTVVRFRVSSLAYELAEYPAGVINAIEVK